MKLLRCKTKDGNILAIAIDKIAMVHQLKAYASVCARITTDSGDIVVVEPTFENIIQIMEASDGN